MNSDTSKSVDLDVHAVTCRIISTIIIFMQNGKIYILGINNQGIKCVVATIDCADYIQHWEGWGASP